MATYGPSYTDVVYITSSSYRRYRGYLYCSTSVSNTTVTISYTAKVQMADAAQYGVKIAVSGGKSATGYLSSSSSSYADVVTVTGTISVARGTSATTKTVKATASGTTVSGYGSAGGSASVSISIPIPAKPSYTITYDANEGSGAPSSQTKWYGTTLTLSDTVPTRVGYNFLGWSTSSTATTATYAAGGSYTSNSAATLYAVWELAYATPTISNLALIRCDESGTATAVGKYLAVSYDWELDPALTLVSASIICGAETLNLPAESAASGSVNKIIGGNLSPIVNHQVAVTVNDSVGISTTESLVLAAEEYSLPIVSNLVSMRTDAEGNSCEEGTSGSVSFNWVIDEMDGTNSISSVLVVYREKGSEDTYLEASVEFEGIVSGTVSAIIPDNALDITKNYEILITVVDQVSSSTRTTIITRSFFTMDLLSGGKGIAFGKASDKEGFDVDMDTHFNKNVYVSNGAQVYGTNAEGNQVLAIEACSSDGNTTFGYGGYELGTGETQVYGNKITLTSKESISSSSTLHLAKTTDVSATEDNDVALIIGDRSAAHMGFDTNEIMAKESGTTLAPLWLVGSDVQISSGLADADVRPYYRAGDTFNVYARYAGYVTSSKTQVHFVIPLCRPIIGSPTISLSSISGFILRQDSSYTHGSSADDYVMPSSYSVNSYGGWGISVYATFSSTTNATNNAPIGVHWSGKVTIS